MKVTEKSTNCLDLKTQYLLINEYISKRLVFFPS